MRDAKQTYREMLERGDASGSHALGRETRELREAFAFFRVSVEDVVVDGDRLAARWTMTGTHVAPWRGIAATGRPMRIEGASFERIAGERFEDGVALWDREALAGSLRPMGEPALATARVGGAEISYGVMGEGSPIVLMHGGLGLDHTSLRPWLDPLADRHTLVYYDHRGNGRSSREGIETVEHARWAEDAEALRAHLGLETMTLFGHSYGSYLALEYALRHPGRLRALVLCATAPKFDYVNDAMAIAAGNATPEQMAALQTALGTVATDDAHFRAMWNAILPIYFHRKEARIFDAMDARARYSAVASNRSLGVCLPAYDVTARLREIRVPTLVLAGSHDWVTPHAQGERVARGIAGAKLVTFGESGHFPFVEEQGRVIEAIEAFFDGLPNSP